MYAVPVKKKIKHSSTSRCLQEQPTVKGLSSDKRPATSLSGLPLSREGQITEAREGQITETREGQVTEAREGQVTEDREGMSFHTCSSESLKSQPTHKSQLKVLPTPAVERLPTPPPRAPMANELFAIYLRTVKVGTFLVPRDFL